MNLSSVSNALPSSVKFAVVGAFGTLFNLVLMALLVEKGRISTAHASLFATEAAIIHNFFINNYWTFGSRKGHLSRINRFLRFHLVALVGLVVNVGVALILVRFGIYYLPAQAAGIMCAWFLNYLTSNRLVFPEVPSSPPTVPPLS